MSDECEFMMPPSRKQREPLIQELFRAKAGADDLSRALMRLERAVRRFGINAASQALAKELAGHPPELDHEMLGLLQKDMNDMFRDFRMQVEQIRRSLVDLSAAIPSL